MAAPAHPLRFSVDGKTAIVTGAGSGINFCFAKALLARNCNVLIADLALRPEAKKLLEDYSSHPKAVFIKTDVTIWDDLNAMFDAADREFGGADIVTPGAGVFEPHWSNFWIPPGSPQSKDSPHGGPSSGVGHYALMDINVTHVLRTTQLAISRWLNPSPGSKVGKASPQNPKRVVCTSSIAGQAPGFAFPMYIASKHAVSGFIRSLEPLDAEFGIRVNGVAPGLIRTPLWDDHPEKSKSIDQDKDIWITPEEVAEQMIACAEDDEIGAGTIWEILKGQYRKVDWRNDPGPNGPGGGMSNPGMLRQEALEWLKTDGWGVVKK